MTKINKILSYLTAVACLAVLATTTGCSQQPSDTPGQSPLTSLAGVSLQGVAIADGLVLVDLQARVTRVNDPTSELGGAIRVGDKMDGSYLYDETLADTRPDKPEEGRYEPKNPPSHVRFHVMGLNFASDPDIVDMRIRLKNDVMKGNPPSPEDSYDVRSRSNLDVLPGVAVKELKIKLVDRSSTALSSIELAGMTLDFKDWNDQSLLTIKGASGWKIEAQITAIAPRITASPKEPSRKGLRYHQS
ncbi:MAG: hypothetical protein ACE5EO_01410 [Candidatus Krumholzibacteriia bacterium]